jgi:hypothetical protein
MIDRAIFNKGSAAPAKSKDFDPAALLIAVVAASISPLLSSGLWTLLDTLFTVIVLVALASYSLSDSSLLAMTAPQRFASWLVIGLISAISVAWPVQQLYELPHWKAVHHTNQYPHSKGFDDNIADRATYFSLVIIFGVIIIAALVALVFKKRHGWPWLVRRFWSQSSSTDQGDNKRREEILDHINDLRSVTAATPKFPKYVDINPLVIGGTVLTRALYAQILTEELFDRNGNSRGNPLRTVNMHNQDCPADMHLHVIWHREGRLYKAIVRVPSVIGGTTWKVAQVEVDTPRRRKILSRKLQERIAERTAEQEKRAAEEAARRERLSVAWEELRRLPQAFLAD